MELEETRNKMNETISIGSECKTDPCSYLHIRISYLLFRQCGRDNSESFASAGRHFRFHRHADTSSEETGIAYARIKIDFICGEEIKKSKQNQIDWQDKCKCS